jgi:basic membrane protein A and related proteins
MKKIFTVIMIIVLCTMGILGCSSVNDSGITPENETQADGVSDETAEPIADPIKIGFVTGVGGKNDKAANQTTHEGLLKAEEELGLDYIVIEPKTIDDFQPALESLVKDGCDLILGLGFDMGPAIQNVAELYPDANFAIVDTAIDKPNIKSLVFSENEGSFLMGVIAGKMTQNNKIGFVGGMDIAVIEKFEAGFAAGVMSVNPEASANLIGGDATSGSTVKFASAFNDVNKGYELGKSLADAGCDVVYQAAGGTGLGVFNAISDVKEKGDAIWAIGTDKDQAAVMPEYANIILSSMIKKVNIASYLSAKEVYEGNFKGGVQNLGILEDAVGIAPSTSDNTPQDVLDIVELYEQMIKDGNLVVPSTREELANFQAAVIE